MPEGPTQITRELLDSLEELRDSLSARVEALSIAVDRLSGRAGDLERRVERRQAIATGQVRTSQMPLGRPPYDQAEVDRRVSQHREALETLQRQGRHNPTVGEERLARMLEEASRADGQETMEQVLDASRARRAAMASRLSAIRSSLPLPTSQTSTQPAREPVEYIPDWPLGRLSGDDVLSRMVDDAISPPTVNMPRRRWGSNLDPGTTLEGLRRAVSDRLSDRSSAVAQRSYAAALLTEERQTSSPATAESSSGGDIGESPFTQSTSPYAHSQLDPTSSLTVRGQILERRERRRSRLDLGERAEETAREFLGTSQAVANLPPIPSEGDRITSPSSINVGSSESSTLTVIEGESDFERISRTSAARGDIDESTQEPIPWIGMAAVATLPPDRHAALDTSPTERWAGDVTQSRSQWPPLPDRAQNEPALDDPFDARIHLLDLGLGGLDIQAIRDIARTASRTLATNNSSLPRPFDFEDHGPPHRDAVTEGDLFSVRQILNRHRAAREEDNARRQREGSSNATNLTDLKSPDRRATNLPKPPSNGAREQMNDLCDNSQTSIAWPSHLPYRHLKARPYVSLLDLPE